MVFRNIELSQRNLGGNPGSVKPSKPGTQYLRIRDARHQVRDRKAIEGWDERRRRSRGHDVDCVSRVEWGRWNRREGCKGPCTTGYSRDIHGGGSGSR